MYSDINDFIADLDKRGLLSRIRESVNPDLEIAAVTDRVCKLPGGGPGLLFERPTGFDIPVATNLFGSTERMCLALGAQLARRGGERDRRDDDAEDAGGHARRLQDAADARSAARPDAENGEGRAVSGSRQARRIAGRAADPEDLAGGRRDGTSRCRWSSPRIPKPACGTSAPTACRCSTAARPACTGSGTRAERSTTAWPSGWASGSKWRWRLSPEPILAYAATAPMPEGLDELLLAGFLGRRRIELVKAVTVDLEVPASAHIVLEGYVEPGERRREGPFGDHTGFYSLADDFPVFHLTCITMRKKPTYLTTVVGIPPQEDVYLGKASERIFLPMIRKTIPEIVDMHFPPRASSTTSSSCRSTSGIPGHARKIMNAFWGLGQLMFSKTIIVVRQGRRRAERQRGGMDCRHARGSAARHPVHRGPMDDLENASDLPAYGSKMGIDATRKWPGEGFTREWPTRLKTSEAASRRAAELLKSIAKGNRWPRLSTI